MWRVWWRTVLIVACAIAVPAPLAVQGVTDSARYARSDPSAGATVASTPFVERVWFTQPLHSRSTLTVVDGNGTQVDLGDGRVDLDDADRTLMLVSLPALPIGVYT